MKVESRIAEQYKMPMPLHLQELQGKGDGRIKKYIKKRSDFASFFANQKLSLIHI